ncbi:hypothetical protein QUA83_05375 [Microcoleus sp. K1-B1]
MWGINLGDRAAGHILFPVIHEIAAMSISVKIIYLRYQLQQIKIHQRSSVFIC